MYIVSFIFVFSGVMLLFLPAYYRRSRKFEAFDAVLEQVKLEDHGRYRFYPVFRYQEKDGTWNLYLAKANAWWIKPGKHTVIWRDSRKGYLVSELEERANAVWGIFLTAVGIFLALGIR